ncbi:ribose ABC transporter permease [candidate division KSB3 bacterium]|uniref:Ribose ABC transporter permease n=1 Tax=candidate division KSB3 bacterium TaxID=2044937 RepID=A0A2G6E7V0_9BACT|nr:MAG: ribose ABC transporter permease [candidate division KSB3 bacterium]PIE30361.1 MAG: ribose ABC transporter permease [candidate division KSB3 bacterium]
MQVLLETREIKSNAIKFLAPIVIILLALTAAACPLLWMRVNPLAAYTSIISGSCGDIYGISETLVKAVPLMLCGLAVAFPLTANRWNLGAEGQFIMGAFGASAVALSMPQLPGMILLPLMLIGGFAAGAFWGWIPGILNVRFNISEIIVSLMMNYIAVNWVSYLVYGPMRDRHAYSNFPFSPKFVQHAWLPRIIQGTRLHLGIVFAVLAAIILYVIIQKTRFGYEIRMVGANPRSARYGGIDTAKLVVLTMAAAGGIAALAGVGEVAALHHQLRRDIAVGYGYTAIPVAMLGKGHPLGILVSSLVFAALLVGGSNMQQDFGVPVALVSIIQALIVLFVVAGETLQKYRIRIVRGS